MDINRDYVVMKRASKDLCSGVDSEEKNSIYNMKRNSVRRSGCVVFPSNLCLIG